MPGNWPARNDIKNPPKSSNAPEIFAALWPLDKVNLWYMDEEKVYANQAKVLDFLADVLF